MIKSRMQLNALIRNKAAGDGDKAQILLRIYMMERLLERISVSRYRDNFILKGGMLVSSLVGILFWLTLVDLAGKPLGESRFVNYMSCNTFWIMGFHILFFNLLNCILMAIDGHIVPLPYFDAEAFRESEWYYWELSKNFRLVYLLFGILGPLALKLIFDRICASVAVRFRRSR